MINLEKSASLPFLAASLFTLILCAVWSIPHTIGIRYIVSLILIALMLWEKPRISPFFKAQPIFLILVIYIFIHIFLISDDSQLALKSFNQEWLKFIIFTLLGAAIGFYVSESYSKDFFLWLGAAFSCPLLIHIFLFLLKSINENKIPIGYAGLSISHGDLGYTALQSSIFLSIYLFSGGNNILKNLIGSILLFFCFLSPYLAQSRGGLIFFIFSTLLIAAFFYLNQKKTKSYFKIFITLFLSSLTIIFLIKVALVAMPEKEQALGDRFKIGLVGNPVTVMCNGTSEIYKDLKEKGVHITPQLEEIIADVNLGTAARVTVARAGFELLLENPMGLFGSKNAYQIALSEKCTPNINMSNTHNGWLDLALALGVPGFIIFMGLFFIYIKIGIGALRNNKSSAIIAGAGLSATGIIWLLRGLLDATSRDQMLEIQAFSLALLAGLIIPHKLVNRE